MSNHSPYLFSTKNTLLNDVASKSREVSKPENRKKIDELNLLNPKGGYTFSGFALVLLFLEIANTYP